MILNARQDFGETPVTIGFNLYADNNGDCERVSTTRHGITYAHKEAENYMNHHIHKCHNTLLTSSITLSETCSIMSPSKTLSQSG